VISETPSSATARNLGKLGPQRAEAFPHVAEQHVRRRLDPRHRLTCARRVRARIASLPRYINVSSAPQKGVRKLPDSWTEHPEIARDLLREAGFTCGVEPRILKGRDPDWTCILDGKNLAGDIYIHEADTTLGAGMAALVLALLGVLLVVVICQAWVIIRLRRTSGRP
jgi:hypothetical protein